MASCSSSLALSCRHPLRFHGGRLPFRGQVGPFRASPSLKWATSKPCTTMVTPASGSESSTEVAHFTNGGGAPVKQPRRRRGRPAKTERSHSFQADGAIEGEEEEEEWDFFGELASHIENESRRDWTGLDAEHNAPEIVESEVVAPASEATENAGKFRGEVDGGVPVAERPSIGGRKGSGEGDSTSGGDDDEVDFNDPKYQLKPEWMEDSVWQAINNQGDEDDDEEQPLWVEEDDPTWPAEEPEDGWGFRTSQFFDKVSITNNKPADDLDDDDDELKMNWDSEADDWIIKEITANDWEYNVFADPGPLIVYAFARYGRGGMDSWKMLEQLEKAVTSVWESGKAPLRAVKVDIGMEIDLGSALDISKDECPQLLFIKNGKGLYKLKEQKTSEELVQLLAHFFYNGKRPSFLKATSTPESLRSVE